MLQMQQVVVFIIKVCSIRGVWRLCLTPIPSKWLLQFLGKSLPSESSELADSTSTHPSYSFMLLHPYLACCFMFSWIFPDSGSHPNLHQPKHSRLRMWWSEACRGEQGGIRESIRNPSTNAKKCKNPCTGKRKYFISPCSMFLYCLMNSLNTIRCFSLWINTKISSDEIW